MSNKHIELPDVGELVVGTCSKISPDGAYFSLYTYGEDKELGFVHISELSRTWVRKISSHIKMGQRIVARVLRVNTRLGQVDMSIKRVTESQKRAKMTELKQLQKAHSIFRVFSEQNNLDLDKLLEEVGNPLMAEYGSLHNSLLEIKTKGPDFLESHGLTKKQSKNLHTLVSKSLETTTVSLIAGIKAVSFASDGINVLQSGFTKALNKSQKKFPSTKLDLSVISAPNYRLVIEAGDWREAETVWKFVQNAFKRSFSGSHNDISFYRQD
ncbi:MAG: S1 RNA-binding domain-containing protein [Candidatus Heimdallarchaeota archaeon]